MQSKQPFLFDVGGLSSEALFSKAKERYGTWPLTVWPIDHSGTTYRALKRAIGDTGEARECSFQGEPTPTRAYTTTVSVFNPQVAILTLNMFAPKKGNCFDPFGGGGTRAICAASHGLNYVGLEIRDEEVLASNQRCKENNVADRAVIIAGDARYATRHVEPNWADFLLTCPPYWNLEKYRGGHADLSMLPSYGEFALELETVIRECHKIMKSGAKATWIVGLLRDANGTLLPLHHDVTRLHLKNGFTLEEEIILNHINTGAIRRVGMFDKGNNRLVRVHEYVLIFKKL